MAQRLEPESSQIDLVETWEAALDAVCSTEAAEDANSGEWDE